MSEIADRSQDARAERRQRLEKRKWGPVLVGTDGSAAAGRAVDAAAELAADLDVDVWVAYVIDRRSNTEARQFSRVEDTSIGDVTETVADSALIKAARRTKAAGATKLHSVVRWEVVLRNSLLPQARSTPTPSLSGVGPAAACLKRFSAACVRSSPEYRP